jgi:hypothetical protein
LTLIPRGRYLISLLEANFNLQGWTFSTRGELCPQGPRSCPLRDEDPLFALQFFKTVESDHPRAPGGKLSPWGKRISLKTGLRWRGTVSSSRPEDRRFESRRGVRC